MKIRHYAGFFTIFFIITLYSSGIIFATAKIDTSRVSDGLAIYEYSGDLKKTAIALWLELSGGEKNTPTMNVSPSVLPMNLGTGTYTLRILEKLPNGQGRPIVSESVELKTVPDEKIMYTASNMNVDFEASKTAIPSYKKLTDGLEGNDVIDKLYEDVINNYTYDHDKANAVTSGTLKGYLPVLDDVYAAKKGICFDYSAILAGSLRSQGIPAKLCKGFATDVGEYHAWNEILVDGKWVVVDSTIDAAYVEVNKTPQFAKDASKFKASSYF